MAALALSISVSSGGGRAIAQRSPSESDPAPNCAGAGAFSYGRLYDQLQAVAQWACSRDHVIALLRASHTPYARPVYRLDAGPIAWTSDRGRTWHQGAWESTDLPRAMAFDPTSGFGLLVGDNSAVWSSHRSGETFVDHGSSPPASFVEVHVLENIGVARDDRGDVYVLRDDGFQRDLAAHAPGGWLEVLPDAIVVHTADGTGDVRVNRGGDVAPR